MFYMNKDNILDTLTIPYDKVNIIDKIYNNFKILERVDSNNGIIVKILGKKKMIDDINKEINRLSDQISNLESRLNSVNKKLTNSQFVSNAPKEIVNHEENKKNRYEKELLLLQNNLNSLK